MTCPGCQAKQRAVDQMDTSGARGVQLAFSPGPLTACPACLPNRTTQPPGTVPTP
jgi:hypothetical protein